MNRVLTHHTVSKENNLSLAYIGDRALCLALVHLFHEKWGLDMPPDVDKRRAYLTSNKRLAEIAEKLDLQLRTMQKPTQKDMADALEALLGYIYLKNGISSVIDLVGRWYGSELYGEFPNHNFKSSLQMLTNKLTKQNPNYNTIPSHSGFISQVFISLPTGKEMSDTGIGSNKRAAEQNAAHNLLNKLGEEV